VTSLEAVYDGTPLMRQIFVYGNTERPSLLAVVVPTLAAALGEFGNSPSLKSGTAPDAADRPIVQTLALAARALLDAAGADADTRSSSNTRDLRENAAYRLDVRIP
jgi:hypothetical protein